jgi:hypothetical protein
MIYGRDKSREMARSILPSTAPGRGRRDKAFVKRGARHAARQAMRRLVSDPSAYDEDAGLSDYPDAKIRSCVWDRRGSDKVAPLTRWGVAVTRQLDRDDRMSYLRSMLPRNLIGQHALGHLSAHRELRSRHEERLLSSWPRPQRRTDLDRGELAQLLRQLLVLPGMHRAFNQWLQESFASRHPHVPGTPLRRTRPLFGLHDVLTFLDAHSVCRRCGGFHRGGHRDTLHAAERFLRAFKALGSQPERILLRLRETRS